MYGRQRRVLSALILGLACAAFTTGAHANPGNGGGSDATPPGQDRKAEVQAAQPQPAQQAEAPGSSAAAPGQVKKAEQTQTQTQAPRSAKAQAPGQAQAQNSGSAKAQAPGQVAKAQQAPSVASAKPSTPPGQAKKAAAAQQRTTPQSQSGSFKATSSGTDLKNDLAHKHTICHATGSSSNPYVMITPSISGVFNGHTGHQDGEDIIPPYVYKGQSLSQNWDAAGQAIFAADCAVPTQQQQAPPQQQQSQQLQQCPPGAVTQQVLLGVWHKTGAVVDGQPKYVFITPNSASAHFDKHEDDIPVFSTTTVTVAGAAVCEQRQEQTAPTSVVVQQQPQLEQAAVAGAQAVTTQPAAEQQQVAGGVAGVQAVVQQQPAAEQAPAGGVLGAVGRVGGAQLPFTGLPLWMAALIGVALLAAGYAVRTASAER